MWRLVSASRDNLPIPNRFHITLKEKILVEISLMFVNVRSQDYIQQIGARRR